MNKGQFNEISTQYLIALHSMKKSDKTVTAYSLAFRKFSDFLEANYTDEQITPLIVVNWRTKLFETGIKQNTIRHYMMVLHTFFKWCVRMKLLEENPVAIEEIPRQDGIEYDLLSLEEIKKVLSSAPSITAKTRYRNYAIVVLLTLTGLRNQELRLLKVSDLNFENKTIHVSQTIAKGTKEREAAFPSQARAVVKEYIEKVRPQELTDDDFLFGSFAGDHGGKAKRTAWHEFTSVGLTRIVKNWVEEITGHKNISSHDLRHAYASLADELGVPLRQLALSMGHVDERLTSRIYISILDKSSAAQTVNKYLE